MQRENVNLKVARKVVKCLYRPWNSYSKCINNRKAWKIPTKVCFSRSDEKNWNARWKEWERPYSCPSDSCRPIHAHLFMPILFMPGPIHARPIHARNGRFMPVPIHAQIDSCPIWPIRACTYSCRDWFMPWTAKRCIPIPIHAGSFSSQGLFMPIVTFSCLNLFMPILIHAGH